ncbi:MAG: DUF4340 domain-containing protein [Steroidobacteraceae bacterium]|nr:DUF4340 domain-containing protein [Steroidobacteraceae bacterium]MDW8260023.1 DUF4340 domain-containing protein [Gammaproteobacteria bacterium]
MSARRRLGPLAAAVLLALGALLWLDWRGEQEASTVRTVRLWPKLDGEINAVREIRLARGDGTKVTLQRDQSGWQVVERAYPADTGKLRKLLLDLAALEIVEEKTRDPALFAKLGVDEPTAPASSGTLVELWLDGAPAGAPAAYALIVGRSAGARELYARRRGETQSFLLRSDLSLDPAPTRWLDTALLDVKPERVRSIEIRVAGEPAFTLSRERADAGELQLTASGMRPRPPATLKTDSASGLLAALSALTFDDVRAAPAAPPPAIDRARVQTFDGLQLDIEGLRDGERRWLRVSAVASGAGTEPADVKQIAARSASREFEIPAYKYDALFRKLKDLLPPAGAAG